MYKILFMNIHEKKIALVKRIVETENPDVLNEIKKIFIENESMDWDQMDDDLKDFIEKGLHEADNGQLISHEQIMDEIKKKSV